MSSENNYDEQYEVIISLYDMAEKIIEEVGEDENGNDILIVEPLLQALSEATNEFAEGYIVLVDNKEGEQKKGVRKRIQQKIETAMRGLFNSINECTEKAVYEERKTKRKSLLSIVKVVGLLRGQVHKVIGVFLNLIDLSSNRFMKKIDLEELERRDKEIAIKLHEISQKRS